MIYRYWDQAALDKQLNARATVGDITPFLDTYARESARMRSEVPCFTGVSYGLSADERLDYFPARQPGSPIFVFIHGGYWRLLDAADSSFMAQMMVSAGAAVVAVNYALAPAASLDEIVRQCRAAIAWVWNNATAVNGDHKRIHVSGSSAGGHLGGMMLAGGWQADFGLPPHVVQSASLLSGLYDLEPVRLSYCNEWARLDEGAVERLSPLRHLPVQPVPLVLSYAPNETEEFKRQTEIYAAACTARGCPVEVVMEPGSNHYDLPLRFQDADAGLTRAALRSMGLAPAG
jgi:arylformamidase